MHLIMLEAMMPALLATLRSKRFWILTSIVLLGAVSRLMPYAISEDSPLSPYIWNFTPLFAMAIFGGACFQQRWAAFLVPLIAMGISDFVLHVSGRAPIGWAGRTTIYSLFIGSTLLGFYLRKRRTAARIGAMAVVSAILFFAVTNVRSWAASRDVPLPASCPETIAGQFSFAFSPQAALIDGYPKTWDGFVACNIMSIPFSRNLLAANFLYCFVFFGVLALVERRYPAVRPEPQPGLQPVLA